MTTGVKRARKFDADSKSNSRKRAKVDSEPNDEAEILELETSITESRKNFNNIINLFQYAQNTENTPSLSILAAVALCRTFCRLIAAGSLTSTKDTPDSEITIIGWLKKRVEDFENLLFSWLSQGDDAKQPTSLTLLIRLMRDLTKLEPAASLLEQRFSKIIECIVEAPSESHIMHQFIEDFTNKYDDIRLHTFRAVSDLLSTGSSGVQLEAILELMTSIDPVDRSRTEKKVWFTDLTKLKASQKRASEQSQKRQAQKAWMAAFRQPMAKSQRKKVLEAMSSHIAPWFLEVELLMDFLTDSFNVGGSTSLTALSGIFYLIQNHNLDYPHFYTKLYSMLDADVLHSKHRSRFFRLLETFLGSTHLPAALVASFIKRLARRSLNASPSAIVVVVPFIYNLLQGHPACTYMIHRTTELIHKNERDWGDPFNDNETDPMITHALESSLWEIQNLQSHFHPNVATIARIIGEPFTKQAYNLEDFLDHSYATMLDAELSKELKKQPEIEYEIPKKVFFEVEPKAKSRPDNLLVQLWDFS